MRATGTIRWLLPTLAGALAILFGAPALSRAACCYFSAKDQDILQPAQKAFITWDPERKLESFTVQPKFEGNALDFGMVIPTPTQPKLHEMPRDFFKHLAVFSILKKREMPRSKVMIPGGGSGGGLKGGGFGVPLPTTSVVLLESGVVGSLDYKIISAERADDLYKWLKDNKYSYSGDEATLNYYVQKKWVFTVMKIDTMQMKKNPIGTYAGQVTPTRFQFTTEKLIYPLRITQISVKVKTEALFYVQAPYKVDLPGDMSYQYTWAPMLKAAEGCAPGDLPRQAADWLEAIKDQLPTLLKRGQDLGFDFVAGQRPRPNRQGRTPTTMEWAKLLTGEDIKILTGKAPYTETVPDVDAAITRAQLDGPNGIEFRKIIEGNLEKALKDHPRGYFVRSAPAGDVKALQQLAGHLQAGLFITKFRKVFTRAEMGDDLVLVPAREGKAEDRSEYEEILPVSPP